MVDISSIERRIQEIKGGLWETTEGRRNIPHNVSGAVQSTISVLESVYGKGSTQVARFEERLKRNLGANEVHENIYNARIAKDIETILDAAVADFRAGLTTSIKARAKSEILGDFVALSRHALDERTEQADRVAAVLAAAALEETLKQLGETNGVDVYNRDYRGVVQKLKDAEVLTGAQPALAQGLSKFRDHAFHGQFEQIARATTESALAFVEGLLTTTLK